MAIRETRPIDNRVVFQSIAQPNMDSLGMVDALLANAAMSAD